MSDCLTCLFDSAPRSEFLIDDVFIYTRYKAAGANAVDATGALDLVEFINVSKDDVLAYPVVARRAYPAPVNARMAGTIQPFVRKSLEVNNTILEIFNDKLGLPRGALAARHAMDEHSGSEARCIRKPPTRNPKDAVTEQGEPRQAIGSHTDFGSLSFLHNRLGGLQVLVPGAETWQYVKVRSWIFYFLFFLALMMVPDVVASQYLDMPSATLVTRCLYSAGVFFDRIFIEWCMYSLFTNTPARN